jgi:hypothetical protein
MPYALWGYHRPISFGGRRTVRKRERKKTRKTRKDKVGIEIKGENRVENKCTNGARIVKIGGSHYGRNCK